ncbi:MAG: hypothetical protein GXY83_14800 [Rhodopirellula sp.]|nr:hypothetical protein [Rhodopirellula sp.]
MEAIPEEKRHLPLGVPGNPIPLVEFTNLPNIAAEKAARRRERNRKMKKREGKK